MKELHLIFKSATLFLYLIHITESTGSWRHKEFLTNCKETSYNAETSMASTLETVQSKKIIV